MNIFLKSIGILLVLLGSTLLIVMHATHWQTNRSLLAGGFLVVTGFVAYIIINRKIQ